MNISRRLVLLPALFIVGIGVAACGDDDEQQPADTDVIVDTTEMMTDTTEMMTDTTEMMTDTTGG